MSRVLQCPDGQYDAATETCAAPVWIETNPAWPELTASDAATISIAVIACWAIAWAWKEVGRTLDRYDRPD